MHSNTLLNDYAGRARQYDDDDDDGVLMVAMMMVMMMVMGARLGEGGRKEASFSSRKTGGWGCARGGTGGCRRGGGGPAEDVLSETAARARLGRRGYRAAPIVARLCRMSTEGDYLPVGVFRPQKDRAPGGARG